MVQVKTITLTYPYNSLQLVNYTSATYQYYNCYLPLVNSDSQLGSEITFIKTNGVTTNTTASLSGFFLGVQSGNSIFTGTASTTLTTTTSIFFYTYVKFVAIKNISGTYGWYVVNVN